jgi:hypothetical protein
LRKNSCVGIEGGVMVVCGCSGAKWVGVFVWGFMKGVKELVRKYGVFIVISLCLLLKACNFTGL